MKNLKITATIILALSMLMGMAGCSSSNKTDRDRSGNYEPVRTVAQETSAAYTPNDNYVNGAAEEEWGYYDYEAEGESYTPQAQSSATSPAAEYESGSQMLIREITMNVETSSFVELTNSIKNKVTELGGYIETSNVSGTGNDRDLRSGLYVIRIPSSNMDLMLAVVDGSCIVTYESENTTDVTLQYSDIQSHITALRSEQSTLLTLLEDTTDMDAILLLQTRLTELSYEIESYESAGRIMANQAAYSTLTLNVEEVLVEVEPEKPEIPDEKEPTLGERMKENLKDSWEDIKEDWKDFSVDFAGDLPYILITLTVLGAIALIVFIVVKVITKKIKKSQAKKAAAKAAVKPVEKAPESTEET